MKYEFLRKTPGLNSIHALNTIPIEKINYYNKRLAIPKGTLIIAKSNFILLFFFIFLDFGYEDELEKYCPGILPEVEYDDVLTDDDSDGEAPPAIKVYKLILKNF